MSLTLCDVMSLAPGCTEVHDPGKSWSTLRIVTCENEVLTALINQVYLPLHRVRSWLCNWSMTIIAIYMYFSEYVMVLKYSAMGEMSVLLCMMSNQ